MFLISPVLAGRPVLPGPITARVEQVLDGDTVRARAMIWLDQEVRITVRLQDVDTPELKGRCSRETELAKRAHQFTRDVLKSGSIVLTNIRRGKYGGRIVARIANREGLDLGEALLKAGFARPYKKRRRSWCGAATQFQS